MKDVIVYRCGKVVADGVELSHVRAVDPPFSDGEGPVFGSVTFDITGTLTYSSLTYEKACITPATIAATRPSIDSDQVEHLYRAGKIAYPSYAALMKYMNIPPCVPPPPPEHKDTARVRRVRERIDNLYKEGTLTGPAYQHLFAALA